MNIVLISTCDMKGNRTEALWRMIHSAQRVGVGIDGRIASFLLLQRSGQSECENFRALDFVRVEAVDGLVGVSRARNLLLEKAFREDLPWDDTIVAFPDDDGWYPPGALEKIVDAFRQDQKLDFWFCRYSAAPADATDPELPPARRPGLPDVVRRASSNTIFMRGGLARRIGRFDEELGLGTALGSSEDTDIALQAFFLAQRSLYVDAALIGHRDPSLALRPRYYRGALAVLASYLGTLSGVRQEFARKLLIGIYLVLRRELSILDYLSAIGIAFSKIGARTKLLTPA